MNKTTIDQTIETFFSICESNLYENKTKETEQKIKEYENRIINYNDSNKNTFYYSNNDIKNKYQP